MDRGLKDVSNISFEDFYFATKSLKFSTTSSRPLNFFGKKSAHFFCGKIVWGKFSNPPPPPPPPSYSNKDLAFVTVRLSFIRPFDDIYDRYDISVTPFTCSEAKNKLAVTRS